MTSPNWSRIERWCAARSRSQIALFCLFLVLTEGYIDYVTGAWVSLSVIYVIPIAIGAWYVSARFAYGLAALSTAAWIAGDIIEGMGPNDLVLVWNGFIRLLFYACLIFVLCRLRDLQRELEHRVHERAVALTKEIAERERLERELTEVSERERRRIGQDLHDGLCQHLTGTALVGQVLNHKLALRALPEAAESQKIVDLIEKGINLARGVAKGLYPVESQPDGLMQALDEFAATASDRYGMPCLFECDSPVLVDNPSTATQLYRIAQEAVNNAARHARASRIVIRLESVAQGLMLAILDDGSGIPLPPAGGGMGLKIMADRAQVIGGKLTIQHRQNGGTEVFCILSRCKSEQHA
ncbi:MAG: sensor histidine kinase [Alphaproteobacteria bacterium]|nr:sensor histidine kinase [Alphaproteobacteria bacterium]